MSNNFMELAKLNPKNIIVRMPNWLGDLIMATPILQDLKNKWPNANITAFCQGALGNILKEDPNINQIITFKKPKGLLKRLTNKDILKELNKENYDLGILLTNSLSSAFLYRQSNIKHRIGYSTHWRRLLLNHPIPFPVTRITQHLVITYKMLLEPLGIPVSNHPPKLYITKEETEKARELILKQGIKKNDIVVGINPGAAYGSAKCWLPERYNQVAKKLLENPRVCLIFFGDQNGAPLVDEICKDLSSRVINLAGKTNLREFMAFLKECDLFLTNDSGPMHMASALGIPLVALFGSTSDQTTGPYQGGTVIHKHVACSPCYRRECPIDFRCMKSIGVDEVYFELKKFLNRAEGRVE